MTNFTDYRAHVGASERKFFKATLFETQHLMLGLNCLEPGQVQALHAHADQSKFYFVVEGSGEFSVGDETRRADAGIVVWAPPGVDHGVTNRGTVRLVLLVGIAPAPTH
jgi:mannose-6-phosphate isomerase-like protein (cupin superfamily)